MERVLFLNNMPAMLVKHERLLVAGDLHVGLDLKFKHTGLHFANATERLADDLLAAYKKGRAKGIVLLGDVKDSITYPTKEEFDALAMLFNRLAKMPVTIVKGNHDAHMDEVLRRLGYDNVTLTSELLLSDAALLHGHALPSNEAMMKECVVNAHSHIALRTEKGNEKAWLIANVSRNAKKTYPEHNKKSRLILIPAFNRLITGSALSDETQDHVPLLKRKVFEFDSAKVFGLDGTLAGKVKDIKEREP